MKLLPKSIVLLTPILLLPAAEANQMTASIREFGYPDPLAWTITSGDDLDFRVSKLFPAPGDNYSTHILIEGLAPMDTGSSVYSSTYSGIDVVSGDILDTGVLYLNMPQGSELPEGTVASPIVGVVQRQGDWDDYNPMSPNTSIGGASGTATSAGGALSLNLTRGVDGFAGTTSYTVASPLQVQTDAFTLSKNAVPTYDLSGATLFLDQGKYVGVVTNLTTIPLPTPPAMQFEYDSLVFTIELAGGADSDGDGVPDLSDDDSTIELVPGSWTASNLGELYGFAPGWAYSDWMGIVYTSLYPWVWQSNWGWFHVAGSAPQGSTTGFWLSSDTLGWVYALKSGNGTFYAQNWAWGTNNFITPEG